MPGPMGWYGEAELMSIEFFQKAPKRWKPLNRAVETDRGHSVFRKVMFEVNLTAQCRFG